MSDTADLSGGDATPAAPSSTALAAQEGANADTDERLQEAGADGQEGGRAFRGAGLADWLGPTEVCLSKCRA